MNRQPHAKKLIVLSGPTATGKSDLAVCLAKKFGGEIICADSRTIYRGLTVGTAKVPGRWVKKSGHKTFVYRGVAHYLVDFLALNKMFSAADFATKAQKLVPSLSLPMIVGGTGFWIDALLQPALLAAVPPNPSLRKKLEKKSVAELFRQLSKLDPARARSLDRHNKRRLIRAIEITLFPSPSHGEGSGGRLKTSEYNVLHLGLTLPNPDLKARIKKRFLTQLKRGLIAETKKLIVTVSLKRLKEIGLQYPIIANYLAGKISKTEMIERSVTSIYHYAKRQKTWFKKNPHMQWIDSYEQAARFIHDFLKK